VRQWRLTLAGCPMPEHRSRYPERDDPPEKGPPLPGWAVLALLIVGVVLLCVGASLVFFRYTRPPATPIDGPSLAAAVGHSGFGR
jgi:hypothetical protein